MQNEVHAKTIDELADTEVDDASIAQELQYAWRAGFITLGTEDRIRHRVPTPPGLKTYHGGKSGRFAHPVCAHALITEEPWIFC